jgi:hypothetical protein
VKVFSVKKEEKTKAPEMPVVPAFMSADGELHNSKWGAVHHNNKKKIQYAYDAMSYKDLIPSRDDFILFVMQNKHILLIALNSLEDENFENEYAKDYADVLQKKTK